MLPLLPLPVTPTDGTAKVVRGFDDAEWKFLVTFLSHVRSTKVLLIDGSNAFFRKPDGSLLHETELKQRVNNIKRTQGGAKLPVLVVSSKLTYKKSIVGQGVILPSLWTSTHQRSPRCSSSLQIGPKAQPKINVFRWRRPLSARPVRSRTLTPEGWSTCASTLTAFTRSV